MAAASKLDLPPYEYNVADGPPCSESQQRKPTRRFSPSGLALFLIFVLVFIGIPRHHVTRYYHSASSHVCHKVMSVEQRAHRILDENPLIDGHVDLAIALRYLYGNHIDNAKFIESFKNGTTPGHVDLLRLRHGQAGGVFWSVYAPCPKDALSEHQLAPIVQYTLDQIDVTARVLEAFPEDFAQKPDSASALRAFSQGKIISPMGVEGLHQIGNSATNLRLFRDLGVRYATLTHNCHNKYADAAVVENPLTKSKPYWGGVSAEGRKMVHEMNRIGMIVDISHVSDDTMVDVLGGKDDWEGSRAPVIFSHSSAWSICPHPRNVKDHILDLVKDRNSLVMVNINPGFISCKDVGNENGLPETDYEYSNLDQIVKHIMHIGKRIGYNHVGIGTDFDGIEDVPEGFRDVTNYPDLVAALLKAGVSDADAAKVVGRNLLRVWRDVDSVSAEMKAAAAPVLEDNITL
ncbi:peptidase M19, renal dipeptidase [Purpureocillium lavendulum]|uniref:Dipeptidase n=1 Tax=Purpureocillium lavendulum TaxID=1247861 RepID=A0AB34FH07_9HYPO|nr:peptidase M19, renal dipeptidase [Purpureocillium lavendulum]